MKGFLKSLDFKRDSSVLLLCVPFSPSVCIPSQVYTLPSAKSVGGAPGRDPTMCGVCVPVTPKWDELCATELGGFVLLLQSLLLALLYRLCFCPPATRSLCSPQLHWRVCGMSVAEAQCADTVAPAAHGNGPELVWALGTAPPLYGRFRNSHTSFCSACSSWLPAGAHFLCWALLQ